MYFLFLIGVFLVLVVVFLVVKFLDNIDCFFGLLGDCSELGWEIFVFEMCEFGC